MSSVIEFIGESFDPLDWTTAGQRGPRAQLEPASRRRLVAPELAEVPDPAHLPVLSQLRSALVGAHSSALRAQARLQSRQLTKMTRPDTSTGPARVGEVTSFKPLAHSATTRLGTAELVRLSRGDVAGVFGSRYDQEQCNPDVRLAAGTELMLTEITALQQRGDGRGRMLACRAPGTDLIEATVQAAEVFALYTGLHLCFADATFVRIDAEHTRVEPTAASNSVEMDVDVEVIDLVPRPWLRVRAQIGNTRVTNVVVALHEKPGVPIGPERGGFPTRWLGRRSSRGERVLLNEFHMTHLSRGDQGIALGPEFAHYTSRKTTRLPTGGLMLVDRVVAIEGQRGRLDGGLFQTEYDSPADAWYYADTANASMPNCVYLETSGQAALLTGYYLGATLSAPDASLSLRQLGGTATVLREVDLRDTTIRQTSELVSTTIAPGATLQAFKFTQSAHGDPFYEGETLFGYFSDETLANQTGLDAGRSVPTWLDAERPAAGLRTIDVAAERADARARLCSHNHLALIDQLTVVDGGGRYGKGYLHAQRPIKADDWLFNWHFPLDPVLPGSFGVESVIQAMQEWLLDIGGAEGMHDPGFVLPVGVPFTWKYRGQFLPTDRMSTLEVHVKQLQSKPGRLRLTADASMWKPGLRIYELTDVAVELRENGAAPW
jgi:3-hydroxymyristoyl/3-hydroxydecanoyl-(acyl carrier protein) dehydratase